MAHNVVFSIPERSLGKADIEFIIRKDRTVIGKLKVSKGLIVWVPKNTTYGYKLNWTDFAILMEENGKHENK